MTPTPMFTTLSACFSLPPGLAQAGWTALTQARWTEPRGWKLDLIYFDKQSRSRTATLDAVLPFLRTTSPPARVLAVLESLVREHRLSRQGASAIEEQVLRRVNARGEWSWAD